MRELTLAAEVVVLVQVVETVFTGGAGSTAGVGFTEALASLLSQARWT